MKIIEAHTLKVFFWELHDSPWSEQLGLRLYILKCGLLCRFWDLLSNGPKKRGEKVTKAANIIIYCFLKLPHILQGEKRQKNNNSVTTSWSAN